MRFRRAMLTAMVLLASFSAVSIFALAQDDVSPLDLAAIPVGPEDVPEGGYLIEGGGFLTYAEQAVRLHGAPDGSGDLAEMLNANHWRRSYMHRLVLLEGRTAPGSDLLADQITLVHEFETADAASTAVVELDAFWQTSGSESSGDDDFPTYRFVVESADSLVTTVVHESIVVEVFSTDFQRQPDLGDHEDVVATTLDRLEATTDDLEAGLSRFAVFLDDMKVTSFADTPDSFQNYIVRNGERLPLIAGTDEALPSGLTEAYQSRQVITLNTRSQFVVQVWLGSFDTSINAGNYALDKGEIETVRVDNPDGERASGYSATIVSGAIVATVRILASGDVVLARESVIRLTDAQLACLEGECPVVSLDDIVVTSGDASSPDETSDGVFRSQNFSWSVDYGAAGWDLNGSENIDGIDFLDLQNGRSLGTIETVVDRHGDPRTCILESLRLLEEFEEHAAITLGSDVEGEQTAGSKPGHAWAVYTVEPLADERADQEYTIRYDCYTLIEGEASLVVSQVAPRDLWKEESAKGNDLRAQIEIDGAAAGASVDIDVMVRTTAVLMPRIRISLAA